MTRSRSSTPSPAARRPPRDRRHRLPKAAPRGRHDRRRRPREPVGQPLRAAARRRVVGVSGFSREAHALGDRERRLRRRRRRAAGARPRGALRRPRGRRRPVATGWLRVDADDSAPRLRRHRRASKALRRLLRHHRAPRRAPPARRPRDLLRRRPRRCR